ncbi:MAG: DUF2064 domain-containing protein, partial [Terriglobia bacterium]
DTWCTVASLPNVRPVLATTRSEGFPMDVPADDMWLQGDGDLGQRIERIITRGLIHAPAAIAVGADSPTLAIAHIGAALELIRTNDAVVGPSIDGGFYLLALRQCPPGLFDSVPWSTAGTRQALMRRLEEHGFTIAQLEPLFDIDTPADLRFLEEHFGCGPSPGSATQAWYGENRGCVIAALPCESA